MGNGALIVAMALSSVFSAQDAPRTSGANAFNPAFGVVVDSRAVFRAPTKEEEKIDLNEIELAFSADVDPFLKTEAYIAIANEDGETNVEPEEVWAQYTNLGHGISGKFGKIPAAIGRVNRNHTDQLDYMEYPLVTQNFLGDEGLRAGGASFSYLFPTDRYLDLTLESLVPEDGPIFINSRTSNPVNVAHLRTFFDFSEDLSGQLGFTVANGPSADGRSTIYGVDYTMKNQPGDVSKFWQLEAEAYWADHVAPGADKASGYFVSATKALRPRLFLTGRWDQADIPGSDETLKGLTANLTLKVTEFHFWRLEYQNIDSNVNGSDSRFTLQFVWTFGAHPAHRY